MAPVNLSFKYWNWNERFFFLTPKLNLSYKWCNKIFYSSPANEKKNSKIKGGMFCYACLEPKLFIWIWFKLICNNFNKKLFMWSLRFVKPGKFTWFTCVFLWFTFSVLLLQFKLYKVLQNRTLSWVAWKLLEKCTTLFIYYAALKYLSDISSISSISTILWVFGEFSTLNTSIWCSIIDDDL